MNILFEIVGVIQFIICRFFFFLVEMEIEILCWRKKRRKEVLKFWVVWIMQFFFCIDLCQFFILLFCVEYLFLKKDELGFIVCIVVISMFEFNVFSNKIEFFYRRCVCYMGKFFVLFNKNCFVS